MNLEPHSPEAGDRALLARVAQGDAGAFSQFHDRFSSVVYSLALQILKDPMSAEDLLQDVFVQIWDRAGAYDPDLGRPLTWIITLTRNRAIDRIRSLQRGQRLVEAATEEQAAVEPVFAGASDELLGKETAAMVRSSLADLPKEQRQAIELAFFRGLSQREIAETLREPLGTIKARIRRGMLSLRDTLQPYLGEKRL